MYTRCNGYQQQQQQQQQREGSTNRASSRSANNHNKILKHMQNSLGFWIWHMVPVRYDTTATTWQE
jgi:hypothetical protein